MFGILVVYSRNFVYDSDYEWLNSQMIYIYHWKRNIFFVQLTMSTLRDYTWVIEDLVQELIFKEGYYWKFWMDTRK